jgi:hypothetical protein
MVPRVLDDRFVRTTDGWNEEQRCKCGESGERAGFSFHGVAILFEGAVHWEEIALLGPNEIVA